MAKRPATKRKAGNGVSEYHPKYKKFAAKWKRARDVLGGQDDIHAAGKAYLPMLLGEETTEFAARIERTPFFNASWRTVAGFVGMLYRKPPVLEASDRLKELLKDVTMSGVSFDNFSKNVSYEDLTTSRVGVFVDYPESVKNEDGTDKELSVAEVESLNRRPSMALYTAEAIRDHDKAWVDGKYILTQVRLDEIQYEAESEFKRKEIPVIRVLDLVNGQYRQRVFDEATEQQIGPDRIALMNGKPLNHIPFYFIGPDGTDSDFEAPVLDDLFTHNVKHYQAYADYVHACHLTGLPTPWITGYNTEDPGFQDPLVPKKPPTRFDIGSTTAWVFPDHQTKVGFLEFTGGGITSLKELVAGYAEEMAAIGARMLAPEKSGVEAAETLAMRHSGENSIVGAVAIAVSSGLTEALKTFALWAGESDAEVKKIKYEINRDFMPFVIPPQLITAWLAAVQAGRMSAEVFFLNMQRGDQIPATRTFEEEQAAIDTDPVPRPVPAGNPKMGVDGKPVDPVEEAAQLADIAKKNAPPKKAA